MSKTTKIIAALGVVAGLGVAALPAFTYATETVTGDVEVDVEILPAIAMTITGNNDDGSVVPFGAPRVSYTAVTPTGDEDPSEEGWYVENAGEYTETTDESVQPGTTYYVQNTRNSYNQVDAFSPAGAASSNIDGHETGTASINALSSSAWKMLPNDIKEGGEFKSTITVYTNAASGYELTLRDADNDNSLVNGSSTIRAVDSYEVETGVNNTVTRGQDSWGYRVKAQHGADLPTPAAWAAVPTASAATISSLPSKTTGGDATVVEYGVSTAADQATGIYRDIITYTATTNN